MDDCPAWDASRCDLIAAIGSDLSLLVKSMVKSDNGWNAVVYCDLVMLVKEVAEKEL